MRAQDTPLYECIDSWTLYTSENSNNIFNRADQCRSHPGHADLMATGTNEQTDVLQLQLQIVGTFAF